jgi:hypothetical protein
MARYNSRVPEHLNDSHPPVSLFEGDLVSARKPESKRGKFAHAWRGLYMIVGSHSAIALTLFKPLLTRKCSELLATLIIYVHSLTRMILKKLILQMFCLFRSPCRPLYRRLAATRLQLANRADVEGRSARRRRRQQVVQSQAFRKSLNANRLWLEQPPTRIIYFDHWQYDHYSCDMLFLHTSFTVVRLNDEPATGPYLSLASLTGTFARREGEW